jgi:hypothetical protein
LESREQRAESRELRAESREMREESRELRAESREERGESRERREERGERREELHWFHPFCLVAFARSLLFVETASAEDFSAKSSPHGEPRRFLWTFQLLSTVIFQTL